MRNNLFTSRSGLLTSLKVRIQEMTVQRANCSTIIGPFVYELKIGPSRLNHQNK